MCPADCLGALQHDCGSCWQTHGTLGPKDGKTWGLRLAGVESGRCGVAQRGLGKSRVLDVQGVVILIFGPHFRYFFAFLGNLAQKVLGPGNRQFNSEALGQSLGWHVTATARGSTSQVVETGPDFAQNSSRSTSRITSAALAPAPKAAAAPAPSEPTEPKATEPEATEPEAGYRSVVALGRPGRKEQLEKGRANLAGKWSLQSIHVYDSTILVAECPCLCQFSGDKSCLPFVCQCLVPWAGWFRFCLPLVMLFVTHLFRLCWCLSAVLVLFATCWATKNFECWKALMSRIIKFSKESFLSFSWQIAGPADQFWLKPFPGK